jgi:hypothetical protein
MKGLLAVLAILFLSANSYSQSVLSSGVISPALTVISIVKSIAENLSNQSPEYEVNVRVTDTDQRNAMKLAFNEACNKAFGSVITSELESNNQRLTTDNITNYSSCYVKGYEILSKQKVGNDGITLEIKILVASNKIANRALGESRVSGGLAGEQHADRIETFRESRQGSDSIVNAVLKDFPERSFTIDILGSKTLMDNFRNGSILINFSATINSDYLDALQETFKNIGQAPRLNALDNKPVSEAPGTIVVNKSRHSFFFGSTEPFYYQFQDMISFKLIKERFSIPLNMLMVSTDRQGRNINLACINTSFNNILALPNLITIGYNNTIQLNAIKPLGYAILLTPRTQNDYQLIRESNGFKLQTIGVDCPRMDGTIQVQFTEFSR